MSICRRSLLLSAAALAASAPALAQPPAAPPATPAADTLLDGLSARRLPLTLAGGRFGGAGWDLLAREARSAKFVLLGEDHGIAEIPALASAIWSELRTVGYDTLALEVSPPMARDMEGALRDGGMAGLRRMMSEPDLMVAFYGMREEAAFLAHVAQGARGPAPVFWGLDYDVGADRRLIARLAQRAPAGAREPLEALRRASAAVQRPYGPERLPFMFGGDPALVAAVRRAWPTPDAQSAEILELLQQTLEINAHNAAQRYWQSNNQRALYTRANFVRRWREAREGGRSPKIMFKFGAFHMTRGRTRTGVFDIGTLAHELAVVEGGTALHVLALGAPGSRQARFDLATGRYQPGDADSLGGLGLSAMAPAAGGGHNVLDLRPLRPLLAGSPASRANPEIARLVHGFDLFVTFSPGTASENLLPEPAS